MSVAEFVRQARKRYSPPAQHRTYLGWRRRSCFNISVHTVAGDDDDDAVLRGAGMLPIHLLECLRLHPATACKAQGVKAQQYLPGNVFLVNA